MQKQVQGDTVTCPWSHSQQVSEQTQAYLLPEPTFPVFCSVRFLPGSQGKWKSASRGRKGKSVSVSLTGKKYEKRECSSLLSALTDSPVGTFLKTKGCFQWLMAPTMQEPYQWVYRTKFVPVCEHHKKASSVAIFFILQIYPESKRQGGLQLTVTPYPAPTQWMSMPRPHFPVSPNE